jgi:hypothetical protein
VGFLVREEGIRVSSGWHTPLPLDTKMEPEGDEFLASEPRGQFTFLSQLLRLILRNQSFCKDCGKFPN